MNGPMGYGYPNQYGGPMNGMGGNMRPAYGAPNGMPVIYYNVLLQQLAVCTCVASAFCTVQLCVCCLHAASVLFADKGTLLLLRCPKA